MVPRPAVRPVQRGITVRRGRQHKVHVGDVPSIRGPANRHVQPSAVGIIQPGATAMVIIVPVKASVQEQHIVLGEFNTTVHLGTVMTQPQVKQPILLVQC